MCFVSVGNRLHSDLARCIVLIAVLRKHCKESTPDHSLILRNAQDKILHVRVKIHELDHGRIDIGSLPVSPEYFEGEILI